MNTVFSKVAAVAVVFGLSAGQVLASGWEVWTEKQGADRLTIITSFAGDGELDEAQVDLKVNAGFEVLDTQVLMKGAICKGFVDQSMLRSVPPSGAGQALKSRSTETCMFTVRVASPKGWQASDVISANPICASSTKGMVSCEAKILTVK